MKLDEFLEKYSKTKIDYDKKYGPQCVDLFRQYCQDVLGIPKTESVANGARELYELYDQLPLEKKYFVRIQKGVQVGDFAIWGKTKTNQYGHVALVIGNMTGKDLLVFEQDGFKLDGAKFKIRTVDNLLGYLRPRKV